MSVNGHEPVMTREVVQALNVQADGTYVDATFGRGGIHGPFWVVWDLQGEFLLSMVTRKRAAVQS